jgi:hypothetical protein
MARVQNSVVFSHPTASCDNNASALRLEKLTPQSPRKARQSVRERGNQRFIPAVQANLSNASICLPIDRRLGPLSAGSGQLNIAETVAIDDADATGWETACNLKVATDVAQSLPGALIGPSFSSRKWDSVGAAMPSE